MQEVVEANGQVVDAAAFRKEVVEWGQTNFRDFPWRHTDNPYYLLMAEVMLHRTRANQVAPVYEVFIERFPTVEHLAVASKEELNGILYSLGLRWRIDLLYDMSKVLMSDFGGRIPEDKDALLSLPGVSDYISSAVRCFAWNMADAIIDTNTVRVIGRVFGFELKDSLRRNRTFTKVVQGLVDTEVPRLYNFALLDLANKICTPKQPACPQCPVVGWCVYGQISITKDKAQLVSEQQGS